MPEHLLPTRARRDFHAVWDDGDFQSTFDTFADDIVWVNDLRLDPPMSWVGSGP
jgi:ketosteroid isomerase-like protein